MAIVKMKKFTLFTFESKKKELIRSLQNLSKVEFINLQDENVLEKYEELKNLSSYEIDSEVEKYEESLSKTKFALDFLKKYVPKKSAFKTMREGKATLTLDQLEEKVESSNWINIYDKLKSKEAEIASLDSQISKFKLEIDSLIPWQDLDVDLGEFDKLKETSYFLGTINKSYEDKLREELSNAYIEIVSRDVNDINLLILSNKDEENNVLEVLRSIGFSNFKIEHKDVPLKVILDGKHKIEELKSKKFLLCEEIAGYEEDLNIIQLAYDYYINRVNRVKVSNSFLKTKNVTMLQGWIAEEDTDNVKEICNKVLLDEYFIDFEDVKEDEIDDVPIKLKNGELVSAFESVTEMYSYPKYNEIDPTPLLTPFYLIFFGMMVADVGYGLVVLIGSFLAMKYLKLEEGMHKFAKFFFYLSFPTIFFGLIYGSFFGDLIILPTQIIDTNTDVMTIIILSLAFGVIQIFCGLIIKAYSLIRMGKVKDAIYDSFSWMITLASIGGLAAVSFLNLPKFLGTVFMVLMILGMVIIVLTGGREEKSKAAQLGQGAYALYGITGYIGDLVSYTRLMALGLAGGSIAGALNLLIGTLPGVAAIVFAPLLFLFAHVFNLGLSLLGAYVHTARLQYVEYFGKFYDGGGKPFKPFKVSEKYVNIKRF